MSFSKGENVGPYRIIEQLGQGGMATVYKAYHPALDRYVAIKALHPAIMEDPNFLSRFEREAKVVAKLEHPNIVPIYDFAEHGGQPYLVMKFIEGETLKARLTKGPLSKEEALRIVDAVGSALNYAHDRGYLHRDVKPSNVLISEDGGIYLADFGLARIAEAGASTLSGDMLMGTPHYISPEQAQGSLKLDEGTDIYSFGVVLYELVVGRVPFTSDTPFSIIHDHIYKPLPLPREVNPAVPELVERVLLKALAKNRVDRFQSVRDMVQSFRASVTGGDIGVLESEVKALEGSSIPPTVLAQTESQIDTGRPARFPDQEPSHRSTPQPVEAAKKSRSRWFWIAAGVVLTCFVLLLFIGALSENSSEPEIEGVDIPEKPIAEVLEPKDEPASFPEEHVRRAEALLKEGDTRAAYNEFVKAGDMFMEQDNYPAAVESYLRAADVQDELNLPDGRLLGKFTQALFLGAPEPPMWPLLERLYDGFPDRDLIQIAAARARLYAESPEVALEELGPVLERNPDSPFARAVQAEIHLTLGEPEIAREIVTALLEDAPLLPWFSEHLQRMKRMLSE